MIPLKSYSEVAVMTVGGAKLGRIKKALAVAIKEGVRASEIEDLAVKLIKEEGAEASFKKVPGYHWATCVNVNGGLVHGIPVSSVVFKKGDIVSIDVGVYYKGFHTDTSISVGVGASPKNQKFLNTGREALARAMKEASEGNNLYDISQAIVVIVGIGCVT